MQPSSSSPCFSRPHSLIDSSSPRNLHYPKSTTTRWYPRSQALSSGTPFVASTARSARYCHSVSSAFSCSSAREKPSTYSISSPGTINSSEPGAWPIPSFASQEVVPTNTSVYTGGSARLDVDEALGMPWTPFRTCPMPAQLEQFHTDPCSIRHFHTPTPGPPSSCLEMVGPVLSWRGWPSQGR